MQGPQAGLSGTEGPVCPSADLTSCFSCQALCARQDADGRLVVDEQPDIGTGVHHMGCGARLMRAYGQGPRERGAGLAPHPPPGGRPPRVTWRRRVKGTGRLVVERDRLLHGGKGRLPYVLVIEIAGPALGRIDSLVDLRYPPGDDSRPRVGAGHRYPRPHRPSGSADWHPATYPRRPRRKPKLAPLARLRHGPAACVARVLRYGTQSPRDDVRSQPCSLICAAPPMSATSRARTEATSSVATAALLPWEVCVRRRGTCYLQVPSSPWDENHVGLSHMIARSPTKASETKAHAASGGCARRVLLCGESRRGAPQAMYSLLCCAFLAERMRNSSLSLVARRPLTSTEAARSTLFMLASTRRIPHTKG